jgi:hypothetical protein
LLARLRPAPARSHGLLDLFYGKSRGDSPLLLPWEKFSKNNGEVQTFPKHGPNTEAKENGISLLPMNIFHLG